MGYNKYRNKRVGGYASKKERDVAFNLQMLTRIGEIKDLKEQVKFELLPTQKGEDGKTIERPVNYIADFTYYDSDGNFVVVDAKGFKTPEYIIKRKLMLYLKGIKIKEV